MISATFLKTEGSIVKKIKLNYQAEYKDIWVLPGYDLI